MWRLVHQWSFLLFWLSFDCFWPLGLLDTEIEFRPAIAHQIDIEQTEIFPATTGNRNTNSTLTSPGSQATTHEVDSPTLTFAQPLHEYRNQYNPMTIFAFWRFWAISQQRVDASTPNFIYVGTMSADVPPPPLGSIGPWGRGRGVKNLKNGGLICAAGSYHFYFLSVAKCGSICREQTCAHSGAEPSRSAKGFLQGGQKSSKKFRIFHHLETLRPYISEIIKNRGI